MEQSLPAGQPLWDMWVVDGLEDSWALVWRVHHTIADGVGAMLLLGHGFDSEPGGGPTLADAILNQPVPPREPGCQQGSCPGCTASGPRSAPCGRRHPHAIPAAWALAPRPPSPLTGAVGPRRVWASVDVPLGEVKATGRALGATVNEVVLACVAGGFRDLLVHRGEPVDGRVVRNLVPVSMRPPGDGSAENRISGMLGHLPVGVVDPVDRLAARPGRRGARSGGRHTGDRLRRAGPRGPDRSGRHPGRCCRGGGSHRSRVVHGHAHDQCARSPVPGVPVGPARGGHVSGHPGGRTHLHHHRHLQLQRHPERRG